MRSRIRNNQNKIYESKDADLRFSKIHGESLTVWHNSIPSKIESEPLLTQHSNLYRSIDFYDQINKIYEEIRINNEVLFKLPINLHELIPEIENSKYILDLRDNWDDQESVGYSFDVWKSAINFLINYATYLFGRDRKIIKVPNIYHGPDGSIDIYWENSQFNFLFNVRPDYTVSYYGDDYGSNKIEGEFNLSSVNFSFLPSLA